jgi:hypothetical protein
MTVPPIPCMPTPPTLGFTRSVNQLSNEDKVLPHPRSTAHHRTWAERQAEKRAVQQAETQALSQRIQASRDIGGADELERARRRQVAELEAFRSFMVSALDAPTSGDRACLRPSMSSFKMVCALIAQRAREDPTLLEPEHRKTLGFYYRMIAAPAYWITLADQLVEHAKAGVTRDVTALGPFAGLRVSTRALLLASGIENVTQLKAAIAAGTFTLDEEIASNGC